MSEKGRDPFLFLEDIFACIQKIEKYAGGVTFKEFAGNEMLVDAVIRNFEIIGEATKKIPKSIHSCPK
jgi:uncharacterized protein with HEPN domain